MKPLKIVLNDRSKQKDLTGQANEDPKPYRNPFGDSDSSDSESEKPKVRQISSFFAARPPSPPKKLSPPPLPPPAKSGPKGSQIARLLARRKDATAGLEKESRDEALFRYDVDRCDEVATAAGYSKRPVEGFGELMLRSMGWQGTPDIKDVSEPAPRPARLGLGAKVEDLPPNLSAKRRKLAFKETRDGRAIDESKTNLQDDAGNDEGKAGKASYPAGGYGVTAESSGRAVVESNNEIATESTALSDKGETRARQRRKRSRFSSR